KMHRERALLAVHRYAPPSLLLPLLKCSRPAICVCDDHDLIRTKEMQLAGNCRLDQLNIGIARHQEMSVQDLKKARASGSCIGAHQEVEQRMVDQLAFSLIKEPRYRRGCLGDQPYAAMYRWISHEAFACQRRIIAPCPGGFSLCMKSDKSMKTVPLALDVLSSPRPVPTDR